MYYGLGDYKSPGLIGRTFFYDGLQIRRDAWRGMGRLAGYGTPGGVWDAWRGMGRLAVCMGRLARGISGHKKSRGILEGESPRQLKFQRPV